MGDSKTISSYEEERNRNMERNNAFMFNLFGVPSLTEAEDDADGDGDPRAGANPPPFIFTFCRHIYGLSDAVYSLEKTVFERTDDLRGVGGFLEKVMSL